MADVLVIRPWYDKATEESYKWADAVASLPEAVDLGRESATRDRVEDELSRDPRLVLFYGHGDDNHLWGQHHVSALDRRNNHLLSGKIVVALACWSSNQLGEEAVRDGRATAYIGYTGAVFLPDEYGALAVCAEAAAALAKALVDGQTCRFAVSSAQEIYTARWRDIYHADPNDPNREQIAARLLRNRNNLHISGDEWAAR